MPSSAYRQGYSPSFSSGFLWIWGLLFFLRGEWCYIADFACARISRTLLRTLILVAAVLLGWTFWWSAMGSITQLLMLYEERITFTTIATVCLIVALKITRFWQDGAINFCCEHRVHHICGNNDAKQSCGFLLLPYSLFSSLCALSWYSTSPLPWGSLLVWVMIVLHAALDWDIDHRISFAPYASIVLWGMLRECGKADAPAKTVLGRTSPSSNLFSLSENELLSQQKWRFYKMAVVSLRKTYFYLKLHHFWVRFWCFRIV